MINKQLGAQLKEYMALRKDGIVYNRSGTCEEIIKEFQKARRGCQDSETKKFVKITDQNEGFGDKYLN